MKILLVEDDMSGMGKMIAIRLGVLRTRFPTAEITIVPELKAALRLIDKVPAPDVTFLDLTLKDSTFEETLARVPEMDAKSPVVIVTGHAEEKVRDLLNRPEVEVIQKNPGMFNRLIGAVVNALRRSRPSDERMEENIRKIEELLPHAAPQ